MQRLRESRRGSKREGLKDEYKNKATSSDISFWIDKNLSAVRNFLKTCSAAEHVLHKGSRGPEQESTSIRHIAKIKNPFSQ